MKKTVLNLMLFAFLSLTGFSQNIATGNASSELIGYNLYRNNEKINTELITELSFTDSVSETGLYNYYVTAVYNEGESDASNMSDVMIDLDFTERKYVLFEKVTGTWCGYCPGAANGLDDMHKNGLNVLGIAYHYNDAYATQSTHMRRDYYGITSAPFAIFDGVEPVRGGGDANSTKYKDYLAVYNERIKVKSPFTMAVNGTVENNTYSANVAIQKIATNNSTNLKLMAVIIEDHIPQAWLGLNELNAVARKLLPDANGSSIAFNNNEQQLINLNFEADTSWIKENCSLIVFIQDQISKEVFQADQIKLNDFATKKITKKSAINTQFYAAYNFKAESFDLTNPIVNLSWDAPTVNNWLQWCYDDNHISMGSSSEIQIFDAAVKWDTSFTKNLEGLFISKFAFFPNDASCEYKLRIWEGENNLVVDSLIEDLNYGEWNTIELNTPYKINHLTNVYIGYHNLNTKSRRSAGLDYGPEKIPETNKIRFYNNNEPENWKNITDIGYNLNWNIKAYLEYLIEPSDTVSNKLKENSFKLYPNPADKSFTIENSYLIEQILIINLNGKIVYDKNTHCSSVSISTYDMHPGIYFIKVVSGNSFSIQKLIIR